MAVLEGFRAVQVGLGLAAAVCGRLLADVGADVARIDPDRSTPLADYLNHGASWNGTLEAADLIVCEGSPATLQRAGHDVKTLHRRNPSAAIVLISPFGQSGPRAEEPATDLTLFFASGIARMLTGQVDDLDEPPISPVGQQSAFIGGIAAACVGMHAALLGNGAVVDVSIHEALATLAIGELSRAGQTGKKLVAQARRRWERRHGLHSAGERRLCRDFAAREPPMGVLAGGDGFARLGPGTPFRHQEGPRHQLGRAARADGGLEPRQAPTLDCRGCPGRACSQFSALRTPGASGIPATSASGVLPDRLGGRTDGAHAGIAVRAAASSRRTGWLDERSATAVGCPRPRLQLGDRRPDGDTISGGDGGRGHQDRGAWPGDPGRASELHMVLGQAKNSIVLDLKKPEAVAIAKRWRPIPMC